MRSSAPGTRPAVPELDSKCLAAFAGRGAGWQEVVADADASGPHGFLIHWRSDMTPVMSLVGDTWLGTAYLMGNHTIAEQMLLEASTFPPATCSRGHPRSAAVTR